MSYIPDNYDLWARHDAEQEEALNMLPKCKCCGNHIQQDKAVCINDQWYCKECEEIAWLEIREDFLKVVK